jgi:hypothetical protein
MLRVRSCLGGRRVGRSRLDQKRFLITLLIVGRRDVSGGGVESESRGRVHPTEQPRHSAVSIESASRSATIEGPCQPGWSRSSDRRVDDLHVLADQLPQPGLLRQRHHRNRPAHGTRFSSSNRTADRDRLCNNFTDSAFRQSRYRALATLIIVGQKALSLVTRRCVTTIRHGSRAEGGLLAVAMSRM